MSHEIPGSPDSGSADQKLNPEFKGPSGEKENWERIHRYAFRRRIKTALTVLGQETVNLPNKERVMALLDQCLSLVPPFDAREEEWLDHELKIDFGEIDGGGEEDWQWTREHPRSP